MDCEKCPLKIECEEVKKDSMNMAPDVAVAVRNTMKNICPLNSVLRSKYAEVVNYLVGLMKNAATLEDIRLGKLTPV